MVQRRIHAARFPATKSLDTFYFLGIPSVNKPMVMQLARCEYVERRENAIGNSGTGKTHIALGLAACQKGMSVGFTTATLRRRFFSLAGRLTRSARRLTLHLPQRWPWENQFSGALARLRVPAISCLTAATSPLTRHPAI